MRAAKKSDQVSNGMSMDLKERVVMHSWSVDRVHCRNMGCSSISHCTVHILFENKVVIFWEVLSCTISCSLRVQREGLNIHIQVLTMLHAHPWTFC